MPLTSAAQGCYVITQPSAPATPRRQLRARRATRQSGAFLTSRRRQCGLPTRAFASWPGSASAVLGPALQVLQEMTPATAEIPTSCAFAAPSRRSG